MILVSKGRKLKLLTITAALVAWLLPFAVYAQTAVSIGTSTAGARFHVLAVGLGDVVSRNSKLNVTVEPIGGSDANIRAIKAKRIGFGLVNSVAATHGLRGTGAFKKDGKTPVRLILQGGTAGRVLIARVDRGIKGVSDLKGKKIQARRRALADLEVVLKSLLKAHGVAESDVTIYAHSNTNEQLEALKLGTADAALMPYGGVKSSSPPIRRLAESLELTVIDFGKDKMAEMLENPDLAGFYPAVVQKDSMKGVDKNINTLGVGEYLVAHSDIADDVVYELTKAFFTNLKKFHVVHASAKEYDLDSSLDNPSVPFHPGAIRFYQEIGIWPKETTGEPQAPASVQVLHDPDEHPDALSVPQSVPQPLVKVSVNRRNCTFASYASASSCVISSSRGDGGPKK